MTAQRQYVITHDAISPDPTEASEAELREFAAAMAAAAPDATDWTRVLRTLTARADGLFADCGSGIVQIATHISRAPGSVASHRDAHRA